MIDSKEFDSGSISRLLSDEAGMMPLKFNMGGSNFKWKILQMVAATKKHDSIQSLINDANELINWVNDELKFMPPISEKDK